jgi:hypothetical protein
MVAGIRRLSFDLYAAGSCGSLERFAILSLDGADCLSCFHSSASASQYFISEYSISLLANAACSRHIASKTLNCFSEYMGVPVVTSSLKLSYVISALMPIDDVVTRIDACANAVSNESCARNLLSSLKKVLMVKVCLLLI